MNNLVTTAKPEDVITKEWGTLRDPVVSVLCTTYNHVDYIKDAIEGFLSQQTNFPFEVLIRDDCSTDGTSEIVRSFALAYPNIITALIEETNTFSKGIKPMPVLFYKAKGDFIALCEGDDYWCSNHKLQNQLDTFTEFPNASLCFHPALEKNIASGQEKLISNYYTKTNLYSLKHTILSRGAGMPTASLFFKRPDFSHMLNAYEGAPIGDFFIQCYMAHQGEVIYLDEVMAVHLKEVDSSWSREWQNNSRNNVQRKRYYEKMISSIDRFVGFVDAGEHKEFYQQLLLFYLQCYEGRERSAFAKIFSLMKLISKIRNFSRIELWMVTSKHLFNKLRVNS